MKTNLEIWETRESEFAPVNECPTNKRIKSVITYLIRSVTSPFGGMEEYRKQREEATMKRAERIAAVVERRQSAPDNLC
ncbi:MAG: hypothetical protein H5T62_06545 [Anaerolineae bacterium]|nr:hypothetical protein [Anaerolineae bacterium]